MKVSIEWLKKYVDINVSSKELTDIISLKCAEVVELKKLVDASKLVVGHIVELTEHPDSDHLHVCQVDVGNEVLQIVCGAPNVKKGQFVITALDGAVLPGNFKIKKSKIRGVESNGMNCSLEELGLESKYQPYDGIFILGDDAVPGTDPIMYLGLDTDVFEFEITPNKGYLLSMIGMAYDVSAALDTSLHFKEPKVVETKEKNDFSVSTVTKDCMSYYGRVIKNVLIKESPNWLKADLIAAGVRPINNVVDITNFVLMETGQPLHAFDYDKISSKKIVVRNALDSEEFVTLDGIKRTLLPSDIVITDGEKPVCLAGVMGGLESEVENYTTNIFLESATFNPNSIRKTSRRLDLRSESSTRFERGVDPARTIFALNRAAELLTELADGEVASGVCFFDNNDLANKEIEVTLHQVNHMIGYEYQVKDVAEVLRRLSFDFTVKDETFKVSVPTRRFDVSTYQDIIEEIIRIDGMDKLPTVLPLSAQVGKLSDRQICTKEIRRFLVDQGLNEVITYSLMNKEQATLFNKEEKATYGLMNALSEERSVLRQSLLPGILNVMKYNLARKQEVNMYFEIGNVFFVNDERRKISGALSGVYASNLWQGKKEVIDFFLVKGIIEALLNKLSVVNVRFAQNKDCAKKLHPGVTADIYANNEVIGFISKLHPSFSKEMGLPETYVFELDFEGVYKNIHHLTKVTGIPKYPAVTRDLALVLDKSISAEQVNSVIKKAGKKTLVSCQVFDVYEDSKIGNDKKQLALKLVFQDTTKTMDATEVEALVNGILAKCESVLGATLRQ